MHTGTQMQGGREEEETIGTWHCCRHLAMKIFPRLLQLKIRHWKMSRILHVSFARRAICGHDKEHCPPLGGNLGEPCGREVANLHRHCHSHHPSSHKLSHSLTPSLTCSFTQYVPFILPATNALCFSSPKYQHQHKTQQEDEIIGRLEAARDDPLGLEASGYALFDMYPERRGNLFADEVYRLVKARDATTIPTNQDRNGQYTGTAPGQIPLPTNRKFSSNDVILLTLQPNGSGDFFHPTSDPIGKKSTSVEARVLNVGPYYVDVAVSGGAFEAGFGPAPNNRDASGKGDAGMRLRIDRFFSSVPYDRMVAALGHITAIPQRNGATNNVVSDSSDGDSAPSPVNSITMDDLFRETIISSFIHNEEGIDRQGASIAGLVDLPEIVSGATNPWTVQVGGIKQTC